MRHKVILDNSPEAAKYINHISGWVSRHGVFFGVDEGMARRHGCTHILCYDCKQPVRKERSLCLGCAEKREIERYAAREHAIWDETRPVYSEAMEHFFDSWAEIDEYLDDCISRGAAIACEDLRLVICDAIYLRTIDSDYWADDFPEDWDGKLPPKVREALDKLNRALREHGPVGWEPGAIGVGNVWTSTGF